MSSLKITVTNKVPAFKKDTVFVLGVKEQSKKVQLTKSLIDSTTLTRHDLEQLGASGTAEAITKVAAPNGAVFALIGVGTEKLDSNQLRSLGGAIARNVGIFAEVVVDLGATTEAQALALIEGFQLGIYEYNGRKSKASIKPIKLTKMTLISDAKVSAEALKHIEVLSTAVNTTRDLVNTPLMRCIRQAWSRLCNLESRVLA